MVTRIDYTGRAVDAAFAVLLEIHRILGEYREWIAVVGGWVPQLLLPGAHVGSTDVDLALDHLELEETGYRSIRESLRAAGYRESDRQPFIFNRDVIIGGQKIEVHVDLLAGEDQGSGRGHRTQRVQDVRARKARGCDLAFDGPEWVKVEGTLPGGVEIPSWFEWPPSQPSW